MDSFELIDWRNHTACRDDPAKPVWEACRAEIIDTWASRHPGTRPYAWWAFDSGLERKHDPRPSYRIILLTIVDSIPEDQRTWLREHGHLQDGEECT